MNREFSALDLQCLSDRRGAAFLPFELTVRDYLGVIVVVGLVVGWGIDHWQAARAQATISSELTAARAAAEQARSRDWLMNDQLRKDRATLVARLQEEERTIARLRREITELAAEARPEPAARYAAGQER
jgi:hypothetical protein